MHTGYLIMMILLLALSQTSKREKAKFFLKYDMTFSCISPLKLEIVHYTFFSPFLF